jgi:Mannosylglycerate hydrolase MGH1-like glycoside hydrolase domain
MGPVLLGHESGRQMTWCESRQQGVTVGAEQDRVAGFGKLEEGLRQASDWYWWGPYVSERQWGTVREDYSPDGEAWGYFPQDHAHRRAYRWGEDAMAGFCDIEQRMCLGLALWNGRDPILKERMFGLTGPQGNHGEDVKEYWWYLDALPSHAWNRWRYHYPQPAFPYDDLLVENVRRDRYDPEYELLDTGVFDSDRYWITEVCYAKADPTDVLMLITVTNAGPDTDTLHVLPTAWFRNTWSWDLGAPKPVMEGTGETSVRVEHPFLGTLELLADNAPDGTQPTLAFCENETDIAQLFGVESVTNYPKDGINNHVIRGATTVNPQRRGTKCAFWYQMEVLPGATAELRLRLRPASSEPKAPAAFGANFEHVIAARRAEADEFYAELTPARATADEAMVMRQAFAGMLWSKQFYYYDVARWLEGDPAQPPTPQQRRTGRNSAWGHFNSFDLLSVPDQWEYPWFAAWDLAFHCVALAHVDPAFAKYQLILLCREWFQHPTGALPAYEWDFGDVNPPVQAWAALEVFAIDGSWDLDFLNRIFGKLLVNFTWWLSREDANGNTVFEGGYLGLDNIGPIDRSHLPMGGILEQCDASGWMNFYSLEMASIAAILSQSGQQSASDFLLKFLEHFAAITDTIDSQEVWDDRDGLFYDRLLMPDGTDRPVKARSLVVLIPMLATAVIDEHMLDQALAVSKQFTRYLERHNLNEREQLRQVGLMQGEQGNQQLLLSVLDINRLQKLFANLFDESEFLSPYGLRALSAYHRDHPFELDVEGIRVTVDYEPGEATTPMFGGNSNWRGPLWFPLNYLILTGLERFHRFFGADLTIEYPTRSGRLLPLSAIVTDLQERLISIFLVGPDGRRPCFGRADRLQYDPAWKDNLIFSEYFHGDNATGLGASHQTGWTGLVADLIRRRHGEVPALGCVAPRTLGMEPGAGRQNSASGFASHK